MTKKPLAKRPARPLSEIAADIVREIETGAWSKSAAFYAAPYLVAMKELTTISDRYYLDSGKSVVLYFLSKAGTWRGETARRIKEELRSIVA